MMNLSRWVLPCFRQGLLWGIACLLLVSPLRADHTDYRTDFYNFDTEANDNAAADGFKTSLYDHFTGEYQIVREFSGGGYLEVNFDLTLDARGRLFGSGDFYYFEPGFELSGPCSVNGNVRGPLGNSTVLFTRPSLTFRVNGTATYDDGVSLYENVPATALMTTKLSGDYEGPPEDPLNYVFGVGNLKMSIPRVINIRYSRFDVDFDLPFSFFAPGTWILDTEVYQHFNSVHGSGAITLYNDRVMNFTMRGYYDDRFEEFVYHFDGIGVDAGNNFTLVETWDGSGYFISFLDGWVLRNHLFY